MFTTHIKLHITGSFSCSKVVMLTNARNLGSDNLTDLCQNYILVAQ